MTPGWLRKHETETVAAGGGTRENVPFPERTLDECARFLSQSVFTETTARADGCLQAMEPRCKLLAFLTLIVAVSFLRSIPLVWGGYLLIMALAIISRVDVAFYLKRVWLTVPLFSLAIILPATLNLVTPGEPLWVIVHLPRDFRFGPWHLPAEIAVTKEGTALAILIVGRVTVSVSLVLLLTMTTPWDRLMNGLRGIGVPVIFVFTMTMAYRYLFMLVAAVMDMHLARTSRTVRYRSPSHEQRWVAGRMGYLFRRSIHAGAEVHEALRSRGFDGDVRVLSAAPPGWGDYAGLASAIFAALLLVAADRLMG